MYTSQSLFIIFSRAHVVCELYQSQYKSSRLNSRCWRSVKMKGNIDLVCSHLIAFMYQTNGNKTDHLAHYIYICVIRVKKLQAKTVAYISWQD